MALLDAAKRHALAVHAYVFMTNHNHSLTNRDPEKANAALTNTLTLQQTAALEQELKTTRQNQEAAQLVGSVLTNVIGDYAKSQTKAYDEASLKKKVLEGQLATATDPAVRNALEKGITEVDATLALNQDKYDMWKEGGVGKIGLHGLAGYLEGRISGGPAGAAAFAAVSNEALSAAVNNAIAEAIASDKTGGSKNDAATAKAYGEAAATLIGSLAGALTGGTQGAAIGGQVALTADQNNRQLHQSEYDFAKRNAKSVAAALSKKEGREVTATEAEGRIVAEILRNSDQQTAQAAGGINDYDIRSVVGCQNLNCNGYKTDFQYMNHNYNAQYIAPNQAGYNAGLSQIGTGQTHSQLVTSNIKKDPVGTTLAGAGMIGLGVVTGGGLPALGLAGTGATIGMGVNGTVQLVQGRPFDWVSFGFSGVTGGASSGMGFIPALLINTGGALSGSGMQGQNPNGAMAGAALGTAIGYPIGTKIEGGLSNLLNPWYRQEWKDLGMGISVFVPKTPIPSWTGGAISSTVQEVLGAPTQNTIEGKK